MSIQIQPARISQAEAISQLVLRNSVQTLQPHYSAEQWSVFLQYYSVEAVIEKIRSQQVFCAYDEDRLAGTIALEGNMVLGFYTDPEMMGRGIGSALLTHLELFAASQNIRELELAASPVAVSFYEQRGWEKVGEEWFIYHGVPFWETRMRKAVV